VVGKDRFGDMPAVVAVLPFENPSGDAAQEYFARGFVEDLTTELSRFATFDVLRPSVANEPPTAGYLLQGSVRRLGDRVRIAVQLIGGGERRQIWAERFDASAETLFDVQDEIVAHVASTLAVEIDGARLEAARRKPVASLEVYDCWLRGFDFLRRGTVEDDERARAFFERALAADPDCARAHAGLSLTHFNEWSCQAWELWDEKQRLAFEHARRAAALDDRDAIVHLVLGKILIYRDQFDEAARHVDRGLALNPSDSEVLAHGALCRAYLGEPEAAVALATRAMRLNPHHPDWYVAALAIPMYLCRRYEDVVRRLAAVPLAMVDQPAYLAAAHALLGDDARAAAARDRFSQEFVDKITFGRAPEPGEALRWIQHVNPFRRPEDTEHLIRGLLRARFTPDPDDAAPRATMRPSDREPPCAAFRRDGDIWTIAYDGVEVRLSDAKGFHDLAELLVRPQAPIHCLELGGRSSEPRGADVVLDARARHELAARARELQREIDDAEAQNDRGAVDSAREELDRIVAELEGALGLGARVRRLGSAAERARAAVTWRIRNAIKKIAAAHPMLGRHLENSIRTGTYCMYIPEKPLDWRL
jgi:TolB-like protein/tetratricopeptide (TPR) repeat protein